MNIDSRCHVCVIAPVWLATFGLAATPCVAQSGQSGPAVIEAFASAVRGESKEKYLFNAEVSQLFEQASDTKLNEWKSHRDITVRVLAHWHEAKRISGRENSQQALALLKCVGVIEGSFATAAPQWWQSAVVDGRFQHIGPMSASFEVSPTFFRSLSKPVDTKTGDVTADTRWSDGTLMLPPSVLKADRAVSLAVRTDGSPRTVIFRSDEEGGGFIVYNSGSAICGAIARFERTGRIVWQRELWGTISTDVSGPVNVPCRIEVRLENNTVTVWGAGYSTCYCEQFEVESGRVAGRFITQF